MRVVRDNEIESKYYKEKLDFIAEEIALNPKQEAEIKEESKLQFKLKLKRLFLFLIACVISCILGLFGFNKWICNIPILLHFILLFYGFSVVFYRKRNNARAWEMYMNKYGKNGKIPPHVMMTHRKLIAQGKKIKL